MVKRNLLLNRLQRKCYAFKHIQTIFILDSSSFFMWWWWLRTQHFSSIFSFFLLRSIAINKNIVSCFMMYAPSMQACIFFVVVTIIIGLYEPSVNRFFSYSTLTSTFSLSSSLFGCVRIIHVFFRSVLSRLQNLFMRINGDYHFDCRIKRCTQFATKHSMVYFFFFFGLFRWMGGLYKKKLKP